MNNNPQYGNPQYPQSGYGSYYGQQQYGAGQYAVPKKKFPWIYVGIGAIAFLILIAAIFFIFLRGPGTPDILVSPSLVNIQTSAGETTTAVISVSNPGKRTIQSSLQTNFPSWMSVDKNIITLDTGETEDIVITASPVAGSEGGEGMIVFSGTDVSVMVNVNVLPAPTVTIGTSSTSLVLVEGEKTSILATISNVGVSRAINCSFELVGIPEGWVKVDEVEPFDVSAGDEMVKPISIEIPDKTDLGTYQGVLSVKGLGFSESIPISITVSRGLGVLSTSVSEISGTKKSDSNIKITIGNTGNRELNDVILATSNSLKSVIDIDPTLIPILESGQSSEVLLTIIGTNGTKTGNIEINSFDTHGNIQTKFITVAITVS